MTTGLSSSSLRVRDVSSSSSTDRDTQQFFEEFNRIREQNRNLEQATIEGNKLLNFLRSQNDKGQF